MDIDDTTKLYLVKAMVEGIPCDFKDVGEMDDFSRRLIEEIENNQHVNAYLSGDCDGILISDRLLGSPYATILFSKNRITFRLLVPEDEIDIDNARNMARIVLNTIGLVTKNTRPIRKKESTIKTFKFNPSQFGIVL